MRVNPVGTEYLKDFFAWRNDPGIIPEGRKSEKWTEAMRALSFYWALYEAQRDAAKAAQLA